MAGALVAIEFDPLIAAFQLQFIASPAITAPTVVFLNRPLHYPSGALVSCSPANALTWHAGVTTNHLEFFYNDVVSAGTVIVIRIVAA